jgi:hypothetical protein
VAGALPNGVINRTVVIDPQNAQRQSLNAQHAAGLHANRKGRKLNLGARICNGLGIMRACLEAQKLEQLESRMDEIADRVARDRTSTAHDRTGIDEAQRISH